MAKKLVKKQTGGLTASQEAERKRDSIYKEHSTKNRAILDSMMKEANAHKAAINKAPKKQPSTASKNSSFKKGGAVKTKKK